jgi:hypothetical protein
MIYYAPQNYQVCPPEDTNLPFLFLAGSIEMGAAVHWQAEVTQRLQSRFNILNPRRLDWDNHWEQHCENAHFFQQVSWELHALEKADVILMYFDPNTKSPISLLELGLFARSCKLVVCCPDGFWRKGNVDIVCMHYKIPVHSDLDSCLRHLENILRN